MIKKLLILSAVSLLLLSGSALAADNTMTITPPDSANFKVGLTGTFDCSGKLTLTVMKRAENDWILDYFDEINCSGGTYDFSYIIDDKTDGTLYNVILTDGENYIEKKFMYCTDVYRKNCLENISQCTEEKDYIEYLQQNSLIFGLDTEDGGAYSALSPRGKECVWKAMYSNRANMTTTEEYVAFFNCAVKEQSFVDSVNNAQNAADLKAIISSGADAVNIDLTDADIEKYLEKICEKALPREFNSYKDIEVFCRENVVLCAVNAIDGSNSAKMAEVLTKYAAYLQIDTKFSSNPKFYASYVAGKTYGTIAALKERITYALTQVPGTAGGGSSSGGGSNKGSGSVILPPPDKNITPVIDDDIFEDINEAVWAKDSIKELYKRGIVAGVSEDKFEPNRNITRAEFAKIAVCAFEMYNSSADGGHFTDVPKDNWAYPYIESAFEKELISGTGDGIFGYADMLTREDMCTIIYRALKKTNTALKTDNDEVEFADGGDISEYAREAVDVMHKAGLVSGVSQTEFGPKAFATRAMVSRIIYNCLVRTEGE